ncbi:MAG: peroxiredoxin family protein [Candidatus Acidiferrales bacterium]
MIPPLTIHTTEGRTVRAWDFKQKKNLVIIFLDSDCEPCRDFLRRLSERAQELRQKEALALVVFLQSQPASETDVLPQGIVVGVDFSGRSARAFLGDDALSSYGLARRGVFIADRYGEIFAQWTISGHEFPQIGEIVAWLDQIEISCEECFPPDPPADNRCDE